MFKNPFRSKFHQWAHCELPLRLLTLPSEELGIQTRATRGFAIPSSCGGLGAFGAWPSAAATTDQVARFARHFLSAEQPIMKALKYPRGKSLLKISYALKNNHILITN